MSTIGLVLPDVSPSTSFTKLQATPLTGEEATKEAVLARMASAEVIHLACHISWKLAALVLSPNSAAFDDSKSSSGGNASKRCVNVICVT